MRQQNLWFKNGAALAFAAFIIIGAAALSAAAQETPGTNGEDEEARAKGITFPVAELGNCGSKGECKTYCDEPDNFKACFAFAKKHKLIREIEEKSDEEVEKFAEAMKQGGPGGCKTPDECRSYCDDPNNIEQCVAFAEKNGLIPKEELEQAKRVAAAVKAGAKLPPQCKNKEQCETFCNATPENMEQCVDFAEKGGFMKPEEAEQAKKMAEVMRSGGTPGNCKGREECETYCHTEENFAECRAFAEKMGFVPLRPEGMMQGGMIEDGRGMPPPMPDNVAACLKEALGESGYEEMQRGGLRPSSEMESKMKNCFMQAQIPGRQDEMMMGGPDQEEGEEMMGEGERMMEEKRGVFQRVKGFFKRGEPERREGDFKGEERSDMKYYYNQYMGEGAPPPNGVKIYPYPGREGQPGMMPPEGYHDGAGGGTSGMMPPQNYQGGYQDGGYRGDGYQGDYQQYQQGGMMGGMPPPSGMMMSPPPSGSFSPPPEGQIMMPSGGDTMMAPPPPPPSESPTTSRVEQLVGFVRAAFNRR